MKEMIAEIIREEIHRDAKTYYFMAGLPRSGSTLLSSILNQNPRFYSGPSSPVVGLMVTLENTLNTDELFRAYPKNEQAAQMISSVIRHYYSDVEKPVVFDKNRSWVNHIHYISGYFDIKPKIICPVRNLDEVLASFIAMHKRNPYEVDGRINFIDEMLVKTNIPLTDDNRCQLLASSDGIVGQSYNGIKQALLQGHQDSIHFVEYDDLVSDPHETMKKLYDFLEEEQFSHDFENLENGNQQEDASVYGFADMHDVRKQLGKTSPDPKEILSDSILEACRNAEFWRDLEEVDVSDLNQDEEDNNTTFIGV
jgi:sulfotransferase